MAARLLIGPALRRVVDRRATIWVETSAPALVRVQAGDGSGEAHTFTAHGHHYALVVVAGLPEGAATPYQVFLDDQLVWPDPEVRPSTDLEAFPPSVIRTRATATDPVRLVFGSCREATHRATSRHLPPDALDAYATRLARAVLSGHGESVEFPDLLMLLGDQVYADVTSKKVRRWLRKRSRRRPKSAPSGEVVTFEEYTKLYLESWRDPEIRWLMSTVPHVMIFDDHEIIDDWNTSASWRRDMQAQEWWPERIASGLSSYWVYQHLGNLHPDQIEADQLYAKVVAAGDASQVLREFGQRVDSESDVAHDPDRWEQTQYSWSYALDVGRTRIVVLDNRCSRVLVPGQRAMLPEAEWRWFARTTTGDYDHLVVGSSLPWLLPPGVHHLEAWNEHQCDSDRPRVAANAERLRRMFDLEHWAAFSRSFEDMAGLFRALGRGAAPPASVNVLSGDVHHSYVARADLGEGVTTPVHQLTCSPVHNQVPAVMRPLLRSGWGGGAARAGRALAHAAGVPRPSLRWRRLAGPYFGNAVSTLVNAGRASRVTIEGTDTDGDLNRVAEVVLNRG